MGNEASATPPHTPVRVGLVGEGTYPVNQGGVSTWCDQLVTGLADHEFAVVTLVGADASMRWPLPGNVDSVTLAPMWDPAPRAPLAGRRAEVRRVHAVLARLWQVALPSGESSHEQVETATVALRELALTGRHPLAATLARTSSAEAIVHAWNRHRRTTSMLPRLTLGEAAEVARLADRILAVLDLEWPQVDLMHVSSNGPAALIALARHWSDGTPMILTEHGIYLRERYLALSHLGLSWPVRYALMALIRVICQVAYAEADLLAPVSDFNARWERRLGAAAERVVTVHNGADVAAYAPIETEPNEPTVSFVGRVDPLKDLHTLIEAFALVRKSVPRARLRIFGPVPDQNRAYHASLTRLVTDRGLEPAVRFEGAVPNARVAAEAGHVVALSSISEGLPFTVIESMMCGRATVATDVGGVAEAIGRDGSAGVVVPPRDPSALAQALVHLLTDDDARRRTGLAARNRATELFSLASFHERMRDLYAKTLVGAPPERADAVTVRRPASRRHRPMPAQSMALAASRPAAPPCRPAVRATRQRSGPVRGPRLGR